MYCWWGWKLVRSLWKTVRRFLRKVKIKVPYDPGMPLLGICKADEDTNLQRYHYVYCSIICNGQIMEEAKCPSTDEWIKKMGHTYISLTYIYIYITYIYLLLYISPIIIYLQYICISTYIFISLISLYMYDIYIYVYVPYMYFP